MFWMSLIAILLIVYTFFYSRRIWKEGYKFASVCIVMLICGSLAVLPFYIEWR
ncbi:MULTISPECIES: hypothetical protein [Bacillus]|uniref:hypothetical protein n=1 Tax=Bacillus TaxID=1386 RepID=UPI001596BB70|nr:MULTISPECIES: hypothetical protein [Bacillus]